MPRRRQQNRGGRPTKFSSAIARKIYQAVTSGCRREAAAALAGISPSTLHERSNKFSEFSDGLEKADARFEAERVALICKAGRNMGTWTANAWLLERKFPQRYGKIDRHLIDTPARGVAMPGDYIQAIREALGYTGRLIHIDAQGNPLKSVPTDDEPIDADVLPQGLTCDA